MADEKEKLNLRVLLNLGHTFAHALETMTHYRQFRHGEAVSIGLSCAFYTSYLLNKIPYDPIKRLHILLRQFSLPIDPPKNIDYKQLIEMMRKDKKAINQQLNLVLLKKIGEVEVVKDVKSSLVLEALYQKEAEKSKD
jgi:3-dehydroquinate synthase